MDAPRVRDDETLERLGPYFFMQKKAGLRLTGDTVSLSEFASETLTENDTVIDLGTATGALALLLAYKTRAKSITGVEVDEKAFETASRNIDANGLAGRVSAVNADYRDLPSIYPEGSFSAVVSNPPYTKAGAGRVSPEKERAAARSEVMGTLADLVKVSKHLAGDSGKIFYVFPVARLSEMLEEACACGLNLRRLRFLRAASGKKASVFLAELGKEGGCSLEEASGG